VLGGILKPSPIELPGLERAGDPVPPAMRDQRSLNPDVPSEPIEGWLYHTGEFNQRHLWRWNRRHPLANVDFRLYGIPTFGDTYDLNNAIETARRWRKQGAQMPGHHWAMDAFEDEFNDLGIPRWTRDAFRNFIERDSHSGTLHRDLMRRTEQLLGYRGLSVDNVFDGLRDFVDRRRLWIAR
jgi:hypothetical protein